MLGSTAGRLTRNPAAPGVNALSVNSIPVPPVIATKPTRTRSKICTALIYFCKLQKFVMRCRTALVVAWAS